VDSRRKKSDSDLGDCHVIVILVVLIGLIYLVPSLGSVLGSVGPTLAALITALLAFLGVVLAQIVTILLFGIGLFRDLRSNQERDEEEQPRETIRAQEDILDRSLDRITDLLSGVPLREPNLEEVDRIAAARAWALTALSRLDRDHTKRKAPVGMNSPLLHFVAQIYPGRTWTMQT